MQLQSLTVVGKIQINYHFRGLIKIAFHLIPKSAEQNMRYEYIAYIWHFVDFDRIDGNECHFNTLHIN